MTQPAPASEVPSALHVNDCAFTAERLLTAARPLGYDWRFLPLAASGRSWAGVRGQVVKGVLGARWLARLALASRQVDVVHVHSGSVLRHSRLAVRDYVLHLHGTDIRTLQYDPQWAAVIRRGVSEARAVLYSTPDLAAHALPLRPDAEYLPVPVDVARLPTWQPDPRRRRVFFASRWEAAKGLDRQLEVARDLVRAVEPDVEVVGLDWGPQASLARDVGVRLLPRLSHTGYLQALAGSSVVIGQAGGILAASELEALGVGVPLVVPVALPLYAESEPPVQPGGADDPVAATLATLATLGQVADGRTNQAEVSRRWVEQHHGCDQAVQRVARLYQRVVTERSTGAR